MQDTSDVPAASKVVEGPDLNRSKSPLDKKEYRQILLPNGLRAVLISDTTAMTQSYNSGGIYMEEDNDTDDDDVDNQSNQEDLKDNEEEEDDSEGDSSSGGDHGLRNAAAAMVVGVGSMSDPPECQGLAHFLEHLLFMGSEKYPEENAYDSFMNKHGGSDNAYTELEYTVYHFEIPQEYLAKGLDMFAQFFTAPLMLESSVDRELNAIESEFQLVKNSDGSRLQHLMSHTCGYSPARHPFAKFSWGNKESLQESPRRNNVDPMVELRKFYDQVSHESRMFMLQSCHRSKMSFFSTTTQQT
jgi:nardilysin